MKQRELRSEWTSEKSDLISFAKLITLYFNYINEPDESGEQVDYDEKQKRMGEFCQKHSLQFKALQEIHMLCFQLDRILEDLGSGFQKIDFNTFQSTQPTKEQESILQQIIIGGLCTNLARKKPIFDKNGLEIKDQKGTKIKYESQLVQEVLQIHPLSCLWKEKPEFIIFSELFSSEVKGEEVRYLKGATKVDDPSWLLSLANQALLSTSQPILETKKRELGVKREPVIFEEGKGKILVQVFYGKEKWPLCHQHVFADLVTGHDDNFRAQVFAYCLLKGFAFKVLKPFSSFLLSNPKSLFEKGNIIPRVVRIQNALAQWRGGVVEDEHTLLKIWKEKDHKFLIDEIVQWYVEVKRAEVKKALLAL